MMSPAGPGPGQRARHLSLALIYACGAGLWILASDRLLAWLVPDPGQAALAGTLKGMLFVAVTAPLLYWLLGRAAARSEAPAPAVVAGPRRVWPPVLAMVAILAITAAAIAHVWQHRYDIEGTRLRTIAGVKAGQVADWLAERERDARFIQSSRNYPELYRRWQAGDQAAGSLLQEHLAWFRQARGLSGVAMYDADGRRLFGIGEAPGASAPDLRAALARAARQGELVRVGPYVGGRGTLRIDFVVPVGDALAVLHAEPVAWLYPMLQEWPIPSDSAEVFLIRRDGDAVVYLDRLGLRDGTASRRPLTSPDLTAARVLRGEARPGELIVGVDRRGVAVVAVAQAIPGTDWLLLAKIDRAEFQAEAWRDSLVVALAGVLALFVAGVALRLLRQQEQLAAAGPLRDALNLLSAIAESSEDAIFAKDLEGRYLMHNRAAEAMTGKPAAEVVGRDDSVLFPANAAQIRRDDRVVLAGGGALRFEETLAGPDGPLQVEVTKTPMRDHDGRVIGLCGIARDISARKRTEQALHESEARFRALVEQALAGIYIIQGDRFRYVNPGFAAIFGYDSPEQLIDRVPVAELVDPDDRERVAENIRRRVEDGLTDIHYTFAGRRRDGRHLDVEVHGRRFDYQGEPAVIGMILDVTARKMAEDALRESELRFHDIVRATADWVWEVDAEGRYTYASESVHDLLGYTPAEIIGKTPFDFMPADEAARVAALFAGIAARREPFRDLDNVNLSKDGRLIHVSTNGMPMLDPDGRLLGYRGLDRDITERRRAELEIHESAVRYRSLLDNLPQIIWQKDADSVYVTCNRTYARAMGTTPEAMAGKTDFDFYGADLAGKYRADDRRIMAAGNTEDFDEHWINEGRERYVHTTKVPLRDASGTVYGTLGIAEDITDRMAAEADLRARNEELERFNRATVDRELAMVELKREVNGLARELGREPPYRLDFLDPP